MISPPNCWNRGCIHYIGILQNKKSEFGEIPACKAFPKGIPDEIYFGSNKHNKIHPEQDNDIVFEKGEET